MTRRRYRRTSGRSGEAGGGEVSRQTTRPPGSHDAGLLAEGTDAVGDVAQQVTGGSRRRNGVGKRQRRASAPHQAIRSPPGRRRPTRIISSEKSAAVTRAPGAAAAPPGRCRLCRSPGRGVDRRQGEPPRARRGAPPGPVAPETSSGRSWQARPAMRSNIARTSGGALARADATAGHFPEVAFMAVVRGLYARHGDPGQPRPDLFRCRVGRGRFPQFVTGP